jgi:hypothetical protein
LRKTSLAFLALAFVIYWLFTAQPADDRQASLSLDPVLPSIIRLMPKPDINGIRRWLSKEADKVGRIDSNPSATVLRFKKKALSLTATELDILKSTALSPGASGDERFLAVYIIGLAESAAARDMLKEIGRTPLPPTAPDRAFSDEVVIRAHALEAVVGRLNPAESVQYLREILAHTNDPALAKHAKYWLNRLE